MAGVLTSIDLPGLTKVASGKVREMFLDGDDALLFVATDRLSAYDVVLANGVPNKAVVLTQLTAYWLRVLSAPDVLAPYLPAGAPPLATHLLALVPSPAAPLSTAERALLRGRCMRVRRLRMFPVEAIVRGYLAGSAYNEYRTHGTVHGEPCQKLPAPVYTPSTKAPADVEGAHDENISREQAAALIGHPAHAARIETLAVALYSAAAAHAAARGVLIADTKFEFGLDEATGEVVLADEVLTPDSSRFWPADQYEPGRKQASLDKQFVRDWLVGAGLKGQAGVAMPTAVVEATSQRYMDVYERLTGEPIDAALARLD
ncbi:phosphoribosyl-aminoimidazole-succinocarboxamide synthase [Niveomyces insectorum RCEF 264]|uniref:Phosphoribosylaminoimidazole-succinocarboxamide synthase n=1 Tax=Niveomyces insectorum RCEF 264 TaxID=1081102 RepID=A0A167UK35_9HYPO|nr:phosphoribosyl-aminoimidazole-succinocarboxamide synthase [Niveomyces insectorum RCEF 264]